MIFKSGDEFDFEGALQSLVEKYGKEEEAAPAPKKAAKKAAVKSEDGEDDGSEAGEKKTRKRKKAAEGDEEDEDGEDKKKVKKTSIVAEERNRPVAEAIKEMADIYFKNKDMRKGGVFSKAAKALRETELHITTAKEAMSLKGIGKGIAGYIEEMLQTGTINKLEELRAGIA